MELRPYRESDVQRLAALANNLRVSRYLIDTFPYPYTQKDASWWIGEGAHANQAIARAIVIGDQLVGSVGLTPQQGWRSHIAEIGYWIGEPYWGRGIATWALSTMTREAFEERGYRRLIAPVLAPNAASAHVLEKCGYRLEGTLTEEVFKLGEFHDILHYARNAPGSERRGNER
ncbi:MAG: GNAT family protein [Pseudomonadota bacterium]